MRLLLTTSTLFFISGFAAVATAAPDSIEFQLPASNVLDLIADRARSSIDCFQPIPFFSTEILVDHVTFPSPPSFRRSPELQLMAVNPLTGFAAHPIQVVLPIKIFLKTRSEMEDPDNPQNDYLIAPETSVIFDLAVADNDGVAELCISPNSIDPPNAFAELVLEAIQDKIGDVCFPLDLDGLDDILDGQVVVTGRVVSASASFDRLAIRLEFDHPDADQTAWQDFVNNGTITPTNTSGFAVAFDKGLLARVLRNRFQSSIESSPELEIEPPGMQSSWMNGVPYLNLFFYAQLDVVGCANTIGLHPVDIGTMFSLSGSGDSVLMNGNLSFNALEEDIFLCGFTWAVFLAHYGVGADAIAMSVLYGLVELLAEPSGDGLPAECELGTNDNFSCEFPLVVPTLAAGGDSHRTTVLTPNSLYVHGNSLIISGDADNHGPSTAAPLATISGGNIDWGIHGNCNNLSIGFSGGVTGSGLGGICEDLEITGDTMNMFAIEFMSEIQSVPFNHDILFGGVNGEDYQDNPYAAEVTIWSSGGGRTLYLGPVDYPSADEVSEAQHDYIFLFANCMAKQTGLFGIPGKFDPNWLVDPPYDISAAIRSPNPAWARRTARVSLIEVSFESLGRTTRPRSSDFFFSGQEMLLSARATIDLGADGRFTVPVTTRVRTNLSGHELAETDIVKALFSEGTGAAFSVSSTALPRDVTAIDFGLDLSPQSLSLQGTLLEE